MKKYFKTHWISIIVLVVSFALLLLLYQLGKTEGADDNGFRISYTKYEKAKVISIDSSNIVEQEIFEDAPAGSQEITIELLSGLHKGEIHTAQNFVGPLYGTVIEKDDPVVVAIYYDNDSIKSINVYEYNRSLYILILFVIFIIVTVLIGRKKGLQSLLGLILSVLSIVFILLPLLFKGFNTIGITLLLCVIISIISYVLLEGVTKKTITATLGTALGLLLSLCFGLFAQALVKVDGMKMGDYIDALLQLKQTGIPLQLRGLLMSGMLIASLGAIMDVAMSIASSIQELVTVNPKLTRKDIIRSGMNIGRDMIGTMTNTLILAFVGSSFVLVLYIYSLSIPIYELLSSTLVATQIVHSIASSIGVIVSVPITVLLSSIIYCKK